MTIAEYPGMRIDRLPEHTPIADSEPSAPELESAIAATTRRARRRQLTWPHLALGLAGLAAGGAALGWTVGTRPATTAAAVAPGAAPVQLNLVVHIGGDTDGDREDKPGQTCPVEVAPEPEPPPAPVPPPAPPDPYACPSPDPVRDSRAGKPISWLQARCPEDGESAGDRSTDDTTDGAAANTVDTACAPDDPVDALRGVAASATRHGVLAVWTERAIFVSRDDGRTFARTLDGPGAVNRVQVDCHGRVIALRGRNMLGIDDGDTQRHRALPFGQLVHEPESTHRYEPPVTMAAGGRYIGWVGNLVLDQHLHLAITDDLGATWSFIELGQYELNEHDLAIATNGRMRLYLTQGERCGEEAFAYRGDARRGTLEAIEGRGYAFVREGEMLDGYTYSTDAHCDTGSSGASVCVLPPGLKSAPSESEDGDTDWTNWAILTGNLPIEDVWTWQLASNGRTHLATLDGSLYRLRKTRAKALTRDVPDEFQLADVDSSKRPIGIHRGHVIRWSKRYGWRVLHGPALVTQ